MTEIWRTIQDYETLYEVSSLGRVRSKDVVITYTNRWGTSTSYTRKGRVLSPQVGTHGYLTVVLSKDNKPVTYLVHRLVAKAFLPKIQGKEYVNHKNENKHDNCIGNLEWVTFDENLRYGTGIQRGHSNRDYAWFHEHSGAKNPNAHPVAQLTKSGELIKKWDCARLAAKELGIHYGSICSVASGKGKSAGGYKWKYININK